MAVNLSRALSDVGQHQSEYQISFSPSNNIVNSSSVHETNRFEFITSGCGDENELANGYMTIYSTGEEANSSFSIQSFQFHHSDTEVYFHCEVSSYQKLQISNYYFTQDHDL